MISVVKQKWHYVPEDLILFSYTVEGISNVINHDLDLRFFIHYCTSQGIDLVKFEIQLRTCVDSISSSSSYAPAPSSSSSSSCISSDEVVELEDVTDDACLIKKVSKKSDAWVNILTGVRKLFEGGIKEVKDCVKKYEINSGRKYKLKKSYLVRYTVECKFKKEENCRWRFHASLLANTKEIYPVAFGIVDSENCDSWGWFLTNLKGIIHEDRPLTIISDRGIGLLKHVPVVFPKAFNSYCLYHMKGNIPVPKGKSRQTTVKLFEECYTALTKEKFYAAAKSMSILKLDLVVTWMMKIPFENWDDHAFLE
ncbi:hypothetical protein C5167_007434 [Papaver somniferum]|nr:hypothetical protein C5167_007434 [Papaver somniferum]